MKKILLVLVCFGFISCTPKSNEKLSIAELKELTTYRIDRDVIHTKCKRHHIKYLKSCGNCKYEMVYYEGTFVEGFKKIVVLVDKKDRAYHLYEFKNGSN